MRASVAHTHKQLAKLLQHFYSGWALTICRFETYHNKHIKSIKIKNFKIDFQSFFISRFLFLSLNFLCSSIPFNWSNYALILIGATKTKREWIKKCSFSVDLSKIVFVFDFRPNHSDKVDKVFYSSQNSFTELLSMKCICKLEFRLPQ